MALIIIMVKTGFRKKQDPWRRAKRSYSKALAIKATPLYPPLWDSTVLYFTFSTDLFLTNTASTLAWEANAYGVLYYSAFYTETRQFFERYRIESMSCELTPLQVAGYPLVQILSCVTHTIAIHNGGGGQNLLLADSSCRSHNVDNTIVRRKWKFDPTDTNENDFHTMPTASTQSFSYGGVFFFLDYSATNSSGGNLMMARINQKYKVRLRGRHGMVLQ